MVAKLYERGLMKRKKDSTDGVIVDKQCGFWSRKGCGIRYMQGIRNARVHSKENVQYIYCDFMV